ncbi:hypothetical protein HDU97_007111 [Phlyctochytrium planicorne]|nr:hypothetical protein HDU97_007111 [Phlyctochytrium planicorne]
MDPLSAAAVINVGDQDIADMGWSRRYKSMDIQDRRRAVAKMEADRRRQSLTIPLRRDSSESTTSATSSTSSRTPPPHRSIHTIQSTDTLEGICIQYGCELSEIKRINKLWTSDSVHLRKVLYIPLHAPPPSSPEFQLRHAPSAHPDNIRRFKERYSTDSESTFVSNPNLTEGGLPRRLSEASTASTMTLETSPMSSISGSANAKSIEDLLRQIDEDVTNVCEALSQLDMMPEAASSLMTGKNGGRLSEDSDAINLISSTTARVSIIPVNPSPPPVSINTTWTTISSPPTAMLRDPMEGTSPSRTYRHPSSSNMEIVIELTPLLRRLPVTAQKAVTEDVRRRTASSFNTADPYAVSVSSVDAVKSEVTIRSVKIGSLDENWKDVHQVGKGVVQLT